MMQIKKNISLILGILIPIFMVAFVAATIYVPPLFPGIFTPPQYNFLYRMSAAYDAVEYSVEDGKLRSQKLPPEIRNVVIMGNPKNIDKNRSSKFFIYDVKENNSKAVSLLEAQALSLDANLQSADGFSVVSGGGGMFMLDFGANYSARYIKGPHFSRKLNIRLNDDNSSYFHFLGWIKN